MSYDGGNLYCSVCGSVQEEKNRFCSSCGNDLDVKGKNTQTPTQYYGTTATTQNQTTSTIPTEGGALVIAVYLAFIGIFTGCFILPIVGLVLVKHAVKNNEDEKNIKPARTINVVSLVITLIILIGIILAFTLPLVFFM